MKTVRVFMIAAGKLVQTITDKVSAQLQRLSAQVNEVRGQAAQRAGEIQGQAAQKADELNQDATNAAGDLRLAACDLREKAGANRAQATQAMELVAAHFDGLKKLLCLLEDGMDAMEKAQQGVADAKDEAEHLVSGKMMMVGDAMAQTASSTGKASELAAKISAASGAASGDVLNKMMAHAVSVHLCGGADGSHNVAKTKLAEAVAPLMIGEDLVSFFMRVADTKNKVRGQVLSPRGEVRKRLFRHFVLNPERLPRQARDEYWGKLNKKGAFLLAGMRQPRPA